jgi:Tol biopolymer transport system component
VNDLKRGGEQRITTSRDLDLLPVWSRDGNTIAYRTGDAAAPRLAVAEADGTALITTLPCPRPYCEPTDWSPDGSLIVNASGGDVWAVPLERDRSPRPLVDEPFPVRDARITRDGAWITYVSEESGRPEVSVRSLSGAHGRFTVSTRGGDQPVWRRDGKELFYVNPDGYLQAVSVRQTSNGGLEFGLPRRLAVPKFGAHHWGTTYDVSTDGGRVYFTVDGNEPHPLTIDVILGWQSLLK